MVICIYAQASDAEEAEVEWFCEDLQDLLEIKLLYVFSPKPCFHISIQQRCQDFGNINKVRQGVNHVNKLRHMNISYDGNRVQVEDPDCVRSQEAFR